jgi:Domain of unknown function (DUF4136)
MKTMIKRLLLSFGLLALAACSGGIRSNVATFHELTTGGGERVFITPMVPEKASSIEFQQYANLIAGELTKYGYKEPGDAEPQLIAGFDVTITEGREKFENRLSGFGGGGDWHHGYGGFGGYGQYWGGGYGGFGGFGGNELYARTIYTATLKFELRTPEGKTVFEGRSEIEARRKDLPALMPYLAAALFQNFPGENGVTRRVTIPKDKAIGK